MRIGMPAWIVIIIGAVSGGMASGCGDDGGGGEVDAMEGEVGMGEGSDASDAGPGTARFEEDFGADGAMWPVGWRPLGGVASATVSGGEGRMVPVVSGYTLGRMGHDLPAGASDVE